MPWKKQEGKYITVVHRSFCCSTSPTFRKGSCFTRHPDGEGTHSRSQAPQHLEERRRQPPKRCRKGRLTGKANKTVMENTQGTHHRVSRQGTSTTVLTKQRRGTRNPPAPRPSQNDDYGPQASSLEKLIDFQELR